MMELLIALIVLTSPFLAVSRFKNKRDGVVVILFAMFVVHVAVAVVTQALSLFSFEIVAGIHILLLVGLQWKWPVKISFSALTQVRPLVIELAVASLAFLYLWSTHFGYSGMVASMAPPFTKSVTDFSYPYPYYSDEWYSVALISDSITNKRLPMRNPLQRNEAFFVNYELPFHSFVAEIMLLLQIDALDGYIYVSFALNTVVVLLMYLLLRKYGVSSSAAVVGAMSLLFITNGANLPGLWNLIPLNLGLVMMLIFFYMLQLRTWWLVVLSFGFTLLFYPPLVVLVGPALLGWLIFDKELSSSDKKRLFWASGLGLTLVVLALASTFLVSGRGLLSFGENVLYSKLWYRSFTGNIVPSYSLWHVIAWPFLFLAAYGLYPLFKKHRVLGISIAVGLGFWLVYSFWSQRVVIEFERVVVATSLLLSVVIGLGTQQFFDLVEEFVPQRLKNYQRYVPIIPILIFSALWFGYTARNPWQKLKATDRITSKVFEPAPPANEFFQVEDAELFRDLRGARFLSLPWKGTVIGVATENYPVVIKQGTISLNRVNLDEFWWATCEEKQGMIQKYRIEYLYLPELECERFEEIGRSSEELVLYKTTTP